MNKMKTKPLIFTLFLLFTISTIQVASAGGSGSEESDVLFINDNYYKVVLETEPSVLEENEDNIVFNISTINDDTQQIVSNVEYKVEVFDSKNILIVGYTAFSPDDKLNSRIVPANEISFAGETIENGSWLASSDSPLVVNAPLFQQGGLVDVHITILSINSEPVSGTNTTFQIRFTMGEFIPFSINVDDIPTDLMFATYFENIEQFHFDQNEKKLTAVMPFDWNEEFLESIPFVHAEYYIPKTVDIFENHEIILTVNNISYFGTIDRSGDEEIVVHFLLSSSKLLKMIDDIPSDQKDIMTFGIQSGKAREVQKSDASLEDGDKVILLSTEEDWKFHLSLSPAGKINPEEQITLNLEFHDPVTNSIIPQNTYDIDVFLNGKIIESIKGKETPDGRDSIKITFDETGAVIVIISNVNNFDTSGQFSFRVTEPKIELSGDHFVEIAEGTSLPGCEKNNSCYEPSLISIQPNEIVLWNNVDDVAHTVTSGSPDKGASGIFDSSIIAGGENYSFKFENKGKFDYFCSLHPWMAGTVIVGDSEPDVPEWVKNNAKWWGEGQINDPDFVTGLEFLVKENVINVPKNTQVESSESSIPDWLRNTAKWWADDLLSDSEFLKGIEWMIKNGIITVYF
ncbi:MAG: plastocyanin/azurin family copper-binding protein [Nitrosopumilus sp. (ex Thoosa mismalolli)]|nr:plastocyanin/azurin family copper-binding protein [Nitrosopumilus sp. (ex Thoosa mismalolli)]